MTNRSPLMMRNLAVYPLVLAAMLLGIPGPAFGQTGQGDNQSAADERRRATALAAEAKAALAAGKVHDALRGFRDAWALARTPAIAANLATVEASFALHRDAAEHFQFALQHLPPDASAGQKQAVSAAFEAEKSQVTTLAIRTVPTVARVSIDGAAVGADVPTDEVFVEPGRHEVHVEAPGYQPATRTIDELAGSTLALEFNLDAIAVAPDPSVHNDSALTSVLLQPSPSQRTERPSRVPLIVGGGLVLLSAAVGTIFLLESNKALRDAEARGRALPPGNSCGSGTPYVGQCRALRDAYDTVDRERKYELGAFVVGGVAAVGTAVYWLWPRAHSRGAPVADASISRGHALVRASWSW